MSAAFEADLSPETNQPRVRFNFANGWSASLVVRTGGDPTRAAIAALAACPTGQWGKGKTELGGQEVSPDEAIAFLAEIAGRARP